ncbi:hypothetical protein GOBAR_AA39883 [Gossypium barbadense]|uniref:Uncharacterized protein n=1 Tax=Gossypium barbadense TaxID=3634 RepID=A0A2P5VPR2_GOSBA|nr:hypothetical protein GOBAR_AA39883 [Gossypium barbadense]
MSLKEVHESFPSSSRGPIHEDRRLQIKELDEWRTHKLRTHDKPKLRQNELNTFPYQLKVGDKVLLDAADPHIVTARPNEEIPLTVLSIIPFAEKLARAVNTPVSNTRGQTCQINMGVGLAYTGMGEANKARHDRTTLPCEPTRPIMSSSRGKKIIVPTSKKWKGASSSVGPTTKIHHPLLQFPQQAQLADVIRALLTPDPWELFFGIIEPTYLELTMKLCSMFHLQTVMTNYDDPGMVQFRLGELICQLSVPEFGTALGLYTEEFKKENELHALTGHIHFSPSKCLHTLAPGAASYNLSRSKVSVLPPSLRIILDPIGQMSPQGILSMLSMRMIERCRGTYPSQYRLAQSTKEEAYEDIPDDVPPQQEDPLTQPPPPSRPVHVVASYADISERLTRFEQ